VRRLIGLSLGIDDETAIQTNGTGVRSVSDVEYGSPETPTTVDHHCKDKGRVEDQTVPKVTALPLFWLSINSDKVGEPGPDERASAVGIPPTSAPRATNTLFAQ